MRNTDYNALFDALIKEILKEANGNAEVAAKTVAVAFMPLIADDVRSTLEENK